MRAGLRGVFDTYLGYLQTIALSHVFDAALNLRVRPTPTLGVQPGQVLNCYVRIVLLSNTHYLTGDALTDLMLDSSGFGTNALRFSSEDLSVIVSVVPLTEIRSLVQVTR